MAIHSSGPPSRPSLFLRLRDARDAEAWQTFVDVYTPLVYQHCRRKGLRHEDAEDVAQKVFLRLNQSLATFEYQPATGRFRDWLGTIVRNEINRFLKKEMHNVHADGGTEEADALNGLAAGNADTAWTEAFHAHVLQTALARSRPHFADDTWRAFEGVWRENRPAAEVARELGRPLDWVYVAKSRVLQHLWEVVQELAEDTPLVGLG